jgi:serine/threonine protein phosphatase PrpC
VISRGIGLKSNPEVVSWDMHDEDTFLLTGGVHEVLSKAEFIEHLSENSELNLAATQIIELALARDANGYLTVLVVRPAQRDAG